MMSAVGFAPLPSEDPELEKLREACKRLNFTIRAIKDAQTCVTQLNLGQARDRLRNAQWQAREAKKLITEVGKDRKARPQRSTKDSK
jgi:hypothetical protein